LTWRRLLVLISQLGADRSANLWRELAGEWADWTPTHQMLAATVNALRIANWQRTDDAGKRAPRHFPEALLPPGLSTDNDNRQVEKFGKSRMTVDQANEWLGWVSSGD
jgi:hypothetical protein